MSALQLTKVEDEPKDFCWTKPSTSNKNWLEETVKKEYLSENNLTIGHKTVMMKLQSKREKLRMRMAKCLKMTCLSAISHLERKSGQGYQAEQ